jgi:predicted metal-dependent hydrolase
VTERVRHGLELFNRGEFFECHEVLEEEWTPERGPRRLFLQALIHVAVGLYHLERGNPTGAIRQLRKGLRKLAGYLPVCEGIDTARLYNDALAVLECVVAGNDGARRPKISSILVPIRAAETPRQSPDPVSQYPN